MWKRDEAVKPSAPPTPAAPASASVPPAAPVASTPAYEPRAAGQRDVVHIGKSVVIKGELNGSEDLTIEGHVEGKIELKDHILTIGGNGRIRAQIFAKSVIVLGEVVGNVTATEKVDIRDNGSVDGDIISPRVAIAEGAHFRGTVDMKRGAGAAAAQGGRVEPKGDAKIETKPAGLGPAGTPSTAVPVANPAPGQKVGA
jgi:cytoskeletal protein CcmA (bactofilin family)